MRKSDCFTPIVAFLLLQINIEIISPLYLCASNRSEIIPFSSTAFQRYFILQCNGNMCRINNQLSDTFYRRLIELRRYVTFLQRANDCFVTAPTFSTVRYPRCRDNNILHIAIARCLNDEKVGAVKIAGQENVSRVYPVFFSPCHVRNGVMRPRRIPQANYGLVTTVGTTFYAITRLCFTAGALTHLPGLIRNVYRGLLHGDIFSMTGNARARHRYCHPLLAKGKETSRGNHGKERVRILVFRVRRTRTAYYVILEA